MVFSFYFFTTFINFMTNLSLLKFRIREEIRKKRYLDTVIHSISALLIYFSFSTIFEIPRELIFLFSFLGSFFPDIDHLLLYKKRRFGNFKMFLKWIIKSERYRIGFELFHNAPTILVLLISLPYLYVKNKLALIFFLAFLFHLLIDLSLDKIVVGKVKWWRFGF